MYKLEDIRQVHLEITQKCQAACTMCDRNINGGAINPHLGCNGILDELTLDDIKSIFKPKFIKQLKAMQLCGNHGDPIVARDTLEVLQYFREHNPDMWLSMNTNAGAKDDFWWYNLAEVLGQNGRVIFSVDGLEDTNHLYRQNVQWKIVERSFHAFIEGGGRARWDFLVFDFNEHQVEEARAKAKQWGVEEFVVKKSSRFITGHTSEKKESHQGQNRKGKKTQLLKEPSSEALKNPALKKHNSLVEKYGSMDKFYDVAEIACRVAKTGSIYLSAEGIIMPCCWTAGRMYKWWHKDPKVEQIWQYIDKAGGKEKLKATKYGLEGVFATGIMDDIASSWDKQGCNNGRIKVCAMKCTKQFDVVGSQYE